MQQASTKHLHIYQKTINAGNNQRWVNRSYERNSVLRYCETTICQDKANLCKTGRLLKQWTLQQIINKIRFSIWNALINEGKLCLKRTRFICLMGSYDNKSVVCRRANKKLHFTLCSCCTETIKGTFKIANQNAEIYWGGNHKGSNHKVVLISSCWCGKRNMTALETTKQKYVQQRM